MRLELRDEAFPVDRARLHSIGSTLTAVRFKSHVLPDISGRLLGGHYSISSGGEGCWSTFEINIL